jgi:hypothetical protein
LRFWRGVVKRLRQEQIVLGALPKSRGNIWILGSVSARYHVARKPPETRRVCSNRTDQSQRCILPAAPAAPHRDNGTLPATICRSVIDHPAASTRPLGVDAYSKRGQEFRMVGRVTQLTRHTGAAAFAGAWAVGKIPRPIGMILTDPFLIVAMGALRHQYTCRCGSEPWPSGAM